MGNPFDISDDDPEYQALLKQYGVGAPVNKAQNTGFAGDVATGLKRGVEQLPGVVTGLADIAATPVSAVTGVKRPFSRGADWLGEQTGFQPAKWAKEAEAEYSPQYQQAKQNVDQAWNEGGFWNVAGALATNPRYAANLVTESLPATVAGGFAARGLMAPIMGAEKLAAARTAAAAGDTAARESLLKYGALAGGVGEGAVTAGQHMSQLDPSIDPLRAAGTALAAGATTGLIGAQAGKLATKLGLEDIDAGIAAGVMRNGKGAGKAGYAKGVIGGAAQEGLLEELPQSMQEQIWQNVAEGKPWNEGVLRAGVEGAVAGGLMGAGVNAMPRSAPKPPPLAEDKPQVDLLGYNPEVGTSWNNTYNYNPIIAEGSESQVSLGQLDMLQGRRDATASAELENTDLSNQRQDALYNMPSFDINDQTLPLPTDPGSAVGVLQVLSHAQEQGQAIVEGSAAHEALLEAQRILTENGLSYLAQRVTSPTTGAAKPPKAEKPVVDAPKQSKPRGKAAAEFEARLTAAVAEGKVAADDPVIADWNASKKYADDAKSFGVALDEKLLGENKVLPTPEENLKAQAAKTAVAATPAQTVKSALATLDANALGLTMKQLPVFEHLRSAIMDNRSDDVIDAQGVLKYTQIADALGMERGSAKSFINGVAKKLAKAQGVSVADMQAALRSTGNNVEASTVDKLGLSPAAQDTAVNEQDLFGNGEGGAEQNMGIINSVGGSQGAVEKLRDGHGDLNEDELRVLRVADQTKNDIPDDGVQTAAEIELEERKAAKAKADAEAMFDAVISNPHAIPAAADFGAMFGDSVWGKLTKAEQADFIIAYETALAEYDTYDAAEQALLKEFSEYGQVAEEHGVPGLQDAGGTADQTSERSKLSRVFQTGGSRTPALGASKEGTANQPREEKVAPQSTLAYTAGSNKQGAKNDEEAGSDDTGSAGEIQGRVSEPVGGSASPRGATGDTGVAEGYSAAGEGRRGAGTPNGQKTEVKVRKKRTLEKPEVSPRTGEVAPGSFDASHAVAPVNTPRAFHPKATLTDTAELTRFLSSIGYEGGAAFLSPNHLETIGGALTDIEAVLGPMWLARVRGFGTLTNRPGDDAVAVKSRGVILVNPILVGEASLGDGPALATLREVIVHEVTHLWDRSQGAIDTVAGADKKFLPGGVVHTELSAMYRSGAAPILDYPFGDAYADESDEFVGQELLAQLMVLYSYSPQLLQQHAPTAYNVAKEMVDGTARHPGDKRGVAGSHVAVLRAIRASAGRQGTGHQVRANLNGRDTPASQGRTGDRKAGGAVGRDVQTPNARPQSPSARNGVAPSQVLNATGFGAKQNTLVKQFMEYIGDKFQSVENSLMFGHNLADKAAALLPGAAKYFSSVKANQNAKVQQEQEIGRIANLHYALKDWTDAAGKPVNAQAAVNKFIDESTSSEKWGYQPEWLKTSVTDSEMAKKFNALSKDAQAVVKAVFKFGKEQQERFDKAVNENLSPEEKITRKQMMMRPYAPLKRFGDHVVVGKSKELVALQAKLKVEGKSKSKELDKLMADGEHYHVEFVDGNFEAISRRDELAGKNPQMSWEKKPLQEEDRLLNGMSLTMLKKLENQIGASQGDKKTKAALASLANQLYIAQLNHLHANKSQQSRKGVKGYDTDMMRAFVSQGRAEAALIANLKTHAESEAALQQISTAAREGDQQDRKTRLANEIMRRHLARLNFKETPIQDALMKTNSFFMLLTSPAYYLTNATQPFVVSMPYMASKFGGAKAWGALRDAYGTSLELVKLTNLFKNNELDTAHLKKFDKVGKEAEALQTLLDENLVNIGLEMELGDIVNQGKHKLTKAANAGLGILRTGVANVEVLNRLSSAVAGYRLAYQDLIAKGKSAEEAHSAATDYARKVILDTHGDYSGYNAPSVMMQGAYGNLPVKVMAQFKKFGFIQAGLLIGTFRQAVNGKTSDMTDAERAESKAAARSMLKWLITTQGAIAGAYGGAIGLPLSMLGAVLAGAFGDDGEDKEAFARRALGGGPLAQLVLHGAPAALGLDISKRVGMAGALDPLRMSDSSTDMKDWAMSLAGPSAGLATKFANGFNYMGKGQYWKGVEQLLPNGVLTNASKVARFESEGLTNTRGEVVMSPEEVSLFTDVAQLLGFQTVQQMDRTWKSNVIYDRKSMFQDKAAEIKRDYVEAVKAGKSPAEARQAWVELQAERVKQGFQRQSLSDLTGAPKEQAKRERNVIHGLQYEKANKGFVTELDRL